jgi:APA family basic amino acid/polyamine antiporter
MSTSAATLFILKKRKQGNENVTGAIQKITPMLCTLFVAAYGFVAAAVVMDKPKSALTGVILLLVFIAVYFMFYHKKPEERRL